MEGSGGEGGSGGFLGGKAVWSGSLPDGDSDQRGVSPVRCACCPPPPFIVNAYFSPVILLPIHHQPLYFFPPTTPLFSFPSAFTQWGLSL